MSAEQNQQPEYYSTGRGGAGNVHQGKPADVREGTPGEEVPHITTEYYSTGRGGAGNMKKNTDGQTARKAQDVEYSGIEPSVSNRSVGRGGYGNIEAERERAEGKKKEELKEPSLLKKTLNFFKSS